MRSVTTVVMFAVFCLACSNATAASYSPAPSDGDLDDLDHYRYYTWGINTPWGVVSDASDQSEQATSATLSFDDIRNWNNEPNVLYIHLLNNAPQGVTQGYDAQGGGDNFAGRGIVLTVYQNLPSTSQDLSYSFSADQLDALNDYASDGRFGLGFDPDCHFYNCGVKLDINTGPSMIPEPATMSLLALGALAVLRRRRKQ